MCHMASTTDRRYNRQQAPKPFRARRGPSVSHRYLARAGRCQQRLRRPPTPQGPPQVVRAREPAAPARPLLPQRPARSAPPPAALNVRGLGTSRSWRRARPGPRRAARRPARSATGAPGPPTYHEPSAVGRRLGAHIVTPPASADRRLRALGRQLCLARLRPEGGPRPPTHSRDLVWSPPPLALGGLGPTSTSRLSSGGLLPATRKRVRSAGEGWQHSLPPGPTQSTRPSPETAPKRTTLAPPTACHSRPYDYG